MNRVARPLSLALVVALMGCGASEEGLVPVAGVVLLDGKPVAKAAVMFHHQAGRTSYGITGDDGRFALTTREPGDGAPAGDHRITVSLTLQEGGVQANDKGVEDYSKPVTPARTTHVVPPIYNDPRTSPIGVNIAKATKSLQIDLESRPRSPALTSVP